MRETYPMNWTWIRVIYGTFLRPLSFPPPPPHPTSPDLIERKRPIRIRVEASPVHTTKTNVARPEFQHHTLTTTSYAQGSLHSRCCLRCRCVARCVGEGAARLMTNRRMTVHLGVATFSAAAAPVLRASQSALDQILATRLPYVSSTLTALPRTAVAAV